MKNVIMRNLAFRAEPTKERKKGVFLCFGFAWNLGITFNKKRKKRKYVIRDIKRGLSFTISRRI